jgi:hypothetical protein
LGAVSPLLRPSWLTADPRITASTRSPSATASDSRFSATIPQPSPRTKPSAAAEKGLQRPSAAIIFARDSVIVALGDRITFTPPARAIRQVRARSACTARCTATSDDEQAVSIVIAGPCRPSTYDRRPEATLDAFPVDRYMSISSSSPLRSSWP